MWYGINYSGTQMRRWGYQNKGKSGCSGKSPFVLEFPLHYLHPSIIYSIPSAFSKTQLPLELQQVLSYELMAVHVFLHFPLEEKGPWGPFYQLRRVLPKGRQILLKALNAEKNLCQEQTFLHPTFSGTVYNH